MRRGYGGRLRRGRVRSHRPWYCRFAPLGRISQHEARVYPILDLRRRTISGNPILSLFHSPRNSGGSGSATPLSFSKSTANVFLAARSRVCICAAGTASNPFPNTLFLFLLLLPAPAVVVFETPTPLAPTPLSLRAFPGGYNNLVRFCGRRVGGGWEYGKLTTVSLSLYSSSSLSVSPTQNSTFSSTSSGRIMSFGWFIIIPWVLFL